MNNTDLKVLMPALKEGLGDIDCAVLQQFVKQKQVAKGDTVVRAGDTVDFAFFTMNGKFAVDLVGRDGSKRSLGPVGNGKWFGQLFFLTPDESLVTVTALEDGLVGILDKESFDRMAKQYAATSDKLLCVLSLELSNGLRQAGRLLFNRFAWDQVEGSEGEEGAKQWFTKVYSAMNGLST